MKINLIPLFLAGAVVTALPAQAQKYEVTVVNNNSVSTTNTTFSVTASVNARAGLASLFEVTCSPVNFGVWRVPVRSSGGTTRVFLDVSANDRTGISNAYLKGNTYLVSLASGYNPPEAGTCIVTGAVAVSTTLPTAISNNLNLSFIASNHEGLGTPGTLALLTADLRLFSGGAGTNPVAIDANGSGSFRVVGILTIPEEIKAENYGGYETGTGATVSVTDMTQTVTPQNSPP